MKFTVDEGGIIQDSDGVDCVFIWGPEGEGMGRVCMAYGETGMGDAMEVAEMICKKLNLERLKNG